MVRASNKKIAERQHLDLLIRLYPGFPAGRIYAGESPDFMVRSGPKSKTGIELTRLTRSNFNPSDFENHFYPDLLRESFTHLIEAKEKKLLLYRKQKPDRIWLIIVVNGFRNSPAFNIHNQISTWNIETTFHTILILDLTHEKVYEVKSPY